MKAVLHADPYVLGMLTLIVALVIVYLWWSHRLFVQTEHYVKHGHKTDPYLEHVRQERTAAGCSISVIVTIHCIGGKTKRFYYHEGSEARFSMTDNGTLYLDF